MARDAFVTLTGDDAIGLIDDPSIAFIARCNDHKKILHVELSASDVGYPIVSKLVASTNRNYIKLTYPSSRRICRLTEHFNSRLSLLDSVCEEIFLVLSFLLLQHLIVYTMTLSPVGCE